MPSTDPRPVAATAVLAVVLIFASVGEGPAAAAAGAKVRVSKLGALPSGVSAGGSFKLTGKLKNSGETDSAARLELSLRGGPAIGSKRIGNVPAGDRRRFKLRVTVPDGVAPGPHTVLACVPNKGTSGKRKCRARRGLTVASAGAPPVQFTPGSRSAGDPLLPQIGNGGYDVSHYEIDLDYEPSTNTLLAASTTITATATQNLSQLSLDFQQVLDLAQVSVNGQPARFERVEATPDLSADPEVTQPWKLVITPSSGIPAGQTLVVRVDYSGVPEHITDADNSIEGWIRACHTSGFMDCDGAFVVNEPIGAQSWFPSNNYPTDKASFDTLITVPDASTALGIGERVSKTSNGDGTSTWHWREDDPTSTYLTTATVGDFNYDVAAMIETSTSRALPIYEAIDSTVTPAQQLLIDASLDQTPAMLNYLSDLYGPYPLDSIGAVVDRATGVGYALEVQTKPHSASLSVDESTHLHEIAHQWFGNTATLETWADIWFNEGWATWSEWIWGFEENIPPGPSPEAQFDLLYADPTFDWSIPPATLDGDPANMFENDPVYDRGAMVVQATREILGPSGFADLISAFLQGHRYGNVSTQEFIATAKEISGFTGAKLALLDQFYEQWLYGTTRPTILPDDFAGP